MYCVPGAIAGLAGGTDTLRPARLEVDLFRDGKGVIDLNAEIPDGALNPSVAKQKLYGTQITGQAADQRRLCSPQRMGAEQMRVQPNAGNTLR